MTDATQTISDLLKAARSESGRSIEEIAADLKIRARYLRALEDHDFSDLPAPAFTAGFVRSYAQALGLDGCALAQAYKREAGGSAEVRPELNFPEPMAESRLPGRAVLLSGLVGMVAIYFGWIADYASETQQASSVEPVPERLASLTAPATQSVESPKPTPSATQFFANAEEFLLGEAQAAAPPEPQDSLAASGDDQPRPIAQVEQTQAAASLPASTANTSRRATVAPAGPLPPARVILTAKSDSWLYVVDAQDREVWNGVLRAGETWSPDRDNLRFMTSNAGGLEIEVDGVRFEPLGEYGGVVRDIPLDPARLKKREKVAMR